MSRKKRIISFDIRFDTEDSNEFFKTVEELDRLIQEIKKVSHRLETWGMPKITLKEKQSLKVKKYSRLCSCLKKLLG